MKITLITVGKLKEDYLRKACAHYTEALSGRAELSIVEVADENTEGNRDAVLRTEGERILKKISPGQYVTALAIDGKIMDSDALSKKLRSLRLSGKNDFVFIIGGSMGLSPEVLSRSDFRLSFSPMTFPHQVMRIMLLDALTSVV